MAKSTTPRNRAQTQQFKRFMDKTIQAPVIAVARNLSVSVLDMLEPDYPPGLLERQNRSFDQMEAWGDSSVQDAPRKRSDPPGDWWNRLDHLEKATVYCYVVERFRGDYNRTFRGISAKGRTTEDK